MTGSGWAELTDAVLASDPNITLADGTGTLASYSVLTVGIPEPATMSLLALGGLGMQASRKRRN